MNDSMDLAKYSPTTKFLLYKSPNGDIKVDVLVSNETIWMPQKKIAELFDVQRPAITKHLRNIFRTKELDEKVVCSILELPTLHGAMKDKTQVFTGITRRYTFDLFQQPCRGRLLLHNACRRFYCNGADCCFEVAFCRRMDILKDLMAQPLETGKPSSHLLSAYF